MRNITPIILAVLFLAIGLTISSPAWRPPEKPKVTIDHVSASKASDGSLGVYCVMVNKSPVALVDVEVSLHVMDSVGTIVRTKELVFFRTDSLRPQQKAAFAESFPDCWDCDSVKAVAH